MKSLFTLALLLGTLNSSAFGYEGKVFSVALGAKLANDVVRRGARLYDGVQASPLLYLGLFDERVQFFLTSLELNDFVVADRIRARTKVSAVSDRPFLETSGPLTIRNARQTSWEWTSRIETFFPSFQETWGQIDLAYAKDLKAHGGHALELTGRLTLARLKFEKEKPLFQPQAFFTVGWGDERHNEYLYGATRGGGINHVAYGLMLLMPSRIDPHFPVVQLYRYDVVGGANRTGSLLTQTSGYHLDITVAVGIL
jgi:hypothetical protein